jgi:hypothetical protein
MSAKQGRVLNYCDYCEEIKWDTTPSKNEQTDCPDCGTECGEVFHCDFCAEFIVGTQCFDRDGQTACKACDFRETRKASGVKPRREVWREAQQQ